MDYRKKIAEVIRSKVDMDLETIENLIEIPPQTEMGDYAFPCFQLAKIFRRDPNIIAKELKSKLNEEGFEKVENLGGYVNFFVDKSEFIKNTLEKILAEGDNYGSSNIGEGKTICIEYSFTNIGKQCEIRDLFSELIGNSLYKLFIKEGYDVQRFNSCLGESFYEYKITDLFNELRKSNILSEYNGVQVVMLNKYNMPPCIISRDDDRKVYSVIDLATTIYRKETYDFYKCIYVYEVAKSVYFKQIFKVLDLLEYSWAEDCIHARFGLFKFQDIRNLNIKGENSILEYLINESIDKVLKLINESNPSLENKEGVAKKIGVGSLVFTFLKNSREKNVIFNLKDILSFEGETSLYVQKTYSIAKELLKRFEYIDVTPNFRKLNSKEELELVKILEGFYLAINNATEELEPSIITKYTIEVVHRFNEFYINHSLLNLKDKGLIMARLELVKATCQVIKNALELIGIEVVEEI